MTSVTVPGSRPEEDVMRVRDLAEDHPSVAAYAPAAPP